MQGFLATQNRSDSATLLALRKDRFSRIMFQIVDSFPCFGVPSVYLNRLEELQMVPESQAAAAWKRYASLCVDEWNNYNLLVRANLSMMLSLS